MEHIIQFGITIDDEVIKQNIEKKAREQITEELKKEIRKELFVGTGWNMDLSYKVKELIKDTVREYQDQIIKDATDQLVDTMKRSKKYKEALAKIAEVTNE